MDLKTYIHGPEQGDKPEQLVILLHGLGANGQDLIGLAPYFAKTLPNAVFVSPDAPQPCDMAPVGYQWFSLREWTPESILAGVKAAAPGLIGFIQEQLEKYDLSYDKLILVGFSQGTMMSLYVGPLLEKEIGGVLGYSGALIWDEDADPKDMQKIPVCLVHGEADGVVPVDAFHHAKAALEGLGYDVEGRTVPGLDHGIDPTGIEIGKAFLSKNLGGK